MLLERGSNHKFVRHNIANCDFQCMYLCVCVCVWGGGRPPVPPLDPPIYFLKTDILIKVVFIEYGGV